VHVRILALTTGNFLTADSGSRLRDYHMCSALSRLGDLDVLTFAPHQDIAGPTRDIDANVMIDTARPRAVSMLASLVRRKLYHGYLFDPRQHKAFTSVAANSYDVIYSSMVYAVPAAVQLRGDGPSADSLVVWDTHNFDPDVWKLMAANSGLLRRVVAHRQIGPAVNAVKAAASSADIVLACTDEDAGKLKQISPAGSVYVVPNGGETEHWSDAGQSTDAVPGSCVIFGTLSQNSTRRGLEWFLDRVWERVREGSPGATLTVAGRDPAPGLSRRVSREPGVRLVVNPADLAAEVAKAQVIAIPQVTGTGSKVKVFEALATGRPIVASSAALSGVPDDLRLNVTVPDDEDEWVSWILSSFDNPPSGDGRRWNRALIDRSDWSASADRLLALLREQVLDQR